jgi:3-oxoacyl-[acyl-carrier-protein] synthase-1
MIYLSSDNIITSLGTDTGEVINCIEKGETGINDYTTFAKLTKAPVSMVDKTKVAIEIEKKFPAKNFTRFESLAILSLLKTLEQGKIDPTSDRTLFILSTTKGNIELLKAGKDYSPDIFLYTTAQKISRLFGFVNTPVVICNACISGVLSLILAKRYIENGKYDQVVITGADVITEFVIAGFESFKSMSGKPCRPFDADRDGLSLGEGAGTILLTNRAVEESVVLVHGASANDANHISGPSRTGEGLFLAGRNTLKDTKDIDFISAHGTATNYNDDMESHAIHRLQLSKTPVNSFKGYFGHTLGAAGIIETILTKYSMLNNRIYQTFGLSTKGTVAQINAVDKSYNAPINKCLKLASGFGGCNAALLLEKE